MHVSGLHNELLCPMGKSDFYPSQRSLAAVIEPSRDGRQVMVDLRTNELGADMG